MRRYKWTLGVLVILAVAGLAACASPGGGGTESVEPTGDGISIRVTNDMVPPMSVVVWAVPETGTRVRLGPLPPNGRRTFNYSPTLRSIPVHLLAVPEGPSTGTRGQARELMSNTFEVLDVKTVTWTVSQRNVRVGG